MKAAWPGLSASREKLVGTFVLLSATAAFGAGNVAHKSMLAEIDTWMSLALRAGAAIAVLLPWAMIEWKSLGSARVSCLRLMVKPVAGFMAGMILQSLGAVYTTATNVGFLINLSAIFTPLICFTGGQCRLGWPTVAACILSLVGAALLGSGVPESLGVGELCCIGAGLGYSWWIIGMQEVSSRFQCAALLTCVQWVAPAILGISMSEHSLAYAASLSPKVLLEAAFLGVGASGVAYLAAAFGQSRLSPVAAALIYPAEAIFGTVLAAFWLGESLPVSGYVGAASIVMGIAIVSVPTPALLRPRSLRRIPKNVQPLLPEPAEDAAGQ